MSEQRKEYKIEGRPSTIYRVVKNKDNPYVMIDRRPVDNPKLSFKAKGILTYLLSRPDGWEVSTADLVKHGAEGEAAVRSGLKELKVAGHMKYTASRNQGRITGWLIEVYEVPQPDSDFQQVEKQDVENRTQVLKTLSRKKKPIIKVSATPKPATPPKPKATDFPEVVLYREVAGLYPTSEVFDLVIESIHKIKARLGRDVTKEDLSPFRKSWVSKGYNRFAITWLEWAESGQIPQNGTWKSRRETPQEPKGFEAGRKFLERMGVPNG